MQACEEMRLIRPDLKVLFVSGYLRDIFAGSNLSGGNSVFIQKPFSADELLVKVRELLDKK